MIREGFTEAVWKESGRDKIRQKKGDRNSFAKDLIFKRPSIVLIH